MGQHIQASKEWKETCKILDDVTWFLWLGFWGFGCFGGFLFSVIIITAFISTSFLSIHSIQKEGKDETGILFCQYLSQHLAH